MVTRTLFNAKATTIIRTHTHAHAHTRTRTHTHTHSHAHTHVAAVGRKGICGVNVDVMQNNRAAGTVQVAGHVPTHVSQANKSHAL